MQAEGIRTGDESITRDDRGRAISGWKATGDAVIAKDGDTDRDRVFVPVRYIDGGEGTRVFDVGQQVPLSFGAGPLTRFPEGTPEYDAYRAHLKIELAKFAAHESPYDGGL